jgi:hypothetical protein
VQIFVKHVLGNVNDTLIWTIVKNAHGHVEDVLKNVIKCEKQILLLSYRQAKTKVATCVLSKEE